MESKIQRPNENTDSSLYGSKCIKHKKACGLFYCIIFIWKNIANIEWDKKTVLFDMKNEVFQQARPSS
jgi:hypothetical protein